jgi:hypothetical protein
MAIDGIRVDMPSKLAQIVPLRVQEDVTVRWLSITTSSTDFLHVAFEAFRHVEVNDPANVGLVDSHPESDRGDNDPKITRHESVLDRSSTGRGQASVVGFTAPVGSLPFLASRFDWLLLFVLQTRAQETCDSLAFISSRAVDDDRLQWTKTITAKQRNQSSITVFVLRDRQHEIVGQWDVADDSSESIWNSQVSHDAFSRLKCGCGGQPQDSLHS